MSGVLIDGIGVLVTHDPSLGTGPLGLVHDAALVLDGGVVAWVGQRAQVPDGAASERVDVGGRTVVPGFVDSHGHLVFAGDRTAGLAARMSGQACSAGGIATTVAATRGATDAELSARAGALVAEALRQGTTTIECRSGYGLTIADERRSPELAARSTPASPWRWPRTATPGRASPRAWRSASRSPCGRRA